jgi:hypothetical protein
MSEHIHGPTHVDEAAPRLNAVDPESLRGMAAAVEVRLTSDRAATLAPQAEQHFALLRHLDAISSASIEPAAAFRLDRGTGSDAD